MSDAYVLTILVTSGDPDGVRVVEKSNWSGRGVVFGRSDLGDAAAQGISSPGIYVLVGEDPDGPFDQRIYVGQGEEVGKRLAQHQRDESKDFWNNTVVFVSKDGGLNRAHIHREASAPTADSTSPANEPTVTLLSPSANAEAEGFLREMLRSSQCWGSLRSRNRSAGQRFGVVTSSRAPTPRVKGKTARWVLGVGQRQARIEETASLSPSFGRLRARLPRLATSSSETALRNGR